jgi:hypothetical protein
MKTINICNVCETVSHCRKNGCIPVSKGEIVMLCDEPGPYPIPPARKGPYTSDEMAAQLREQNTALDEACGKYEQELAAEREKVRVLTATLRGIAVADTKTWDPGFQSTGDFMYWAQSRARAALAAPACRKCSGKMRPGKAIAQTFTSGSPDFPGDKSGITYSPGSPGELIDCLKCAACG